MIEKLDFLFELGTEELPPLALIKLSESLKQNIQLGLDKAQLNHGNIEIYATPRRLAILIYNLVTRQADRNIEKRGPALNVAVDNNGNYTPQALGFARSCSVNVDQLEKLITDKGSWLIFRKQELGNATAELLPSIINQALDNLPIHKRMHWGASKIEFVRPVHWVLMLFGDQVIDVEILGQRTGRTTRGHRFHHPEIINISKPSEYVTNLEQYGMVLADFANRRNIIHNQVEIAASKINGHAIIDESLLNEVTSLVEWPIAVTGTFESRFLAVPREVLISTMKNKQKYFAVVDNTAKLLPYFITISNIAGLDLTSIREGNERVIRPRLADAAFFWEQDRRNSLNSRIDGLKTMLFHERLGSLYDKSFRISQLSAYIAQCLNHQQDNVVRASIIAKCDLLTDMVSEFPELQGIIGRYYAENDGEAIEVSVALAEQYLPRFAGDNIPSSINGQILALADRLDTLVGIFGIGMSPSGDKDPFGLRRAALGALRIIIEGHLDLDLIQLLQHTLTIFQQSLPDTLNQIDVIEEAYNFMMERLRGYFIEQGFQSDEFEAVMIRLPSQPLDIKIRIQAVHDFRKLDESVSLIAANKRIKNILRQSKNEISKNIDKHLLTETAEQQLITSFEKLENAIIPLCEKRNYYGVLTKLAELKTNIDNFFDSVMVMTDDQGTRKNRISLLNKIADSFLRIADISCLK